MNAPAGLQRQLEALLATAEIRESAFAGGRLQWQRWSDSAAGPVLILLHGGFGSWNHWFANINTLRQQRELWTVDLPGLGESGDIPREATTGNFTMALQAGLRALIGERDYELAGFSFGAMIGAQLAADPHCRRFTAVGAAGCGELHSQVALQSPPSIVTPWAEALPVHRANLRALMLSHSADISEMAAYLHGYNLSRHRFNSRSLSRSNDFLAALPALNGKLVAIWGSEDATAGGEQAIEARRQRITRLLPAAQFELLQGVGHWAMWEAPGPINQVLLAD